jgi:hypothetical protein
MEPPASQTPDCVFADAASHSHAVQTSMEAIYNWNYAPEIDELRTL